VAWYEQAMIDYLHTQATGFTVFTAESVVQRFPPPHSSTAGQKALAAAIALEHLASKGVLICEKVNGMWRCFND
jgi:hypothetical protein